MGDAAKTAGSQKKHLVFKGVRTQWPAVAEDDGLARPPIFEINLRSVFGCDCVHLFFSFVSGLVVYLRRRRVRRFSFGGECRYRETGNSRESGAVDKKFSTRHTGQVILDGGMIDFGETKRFGFHI